MSDECREAFEKWLKTQAGTHNSFDRFRMEKAWEAAWNTRQAALQGTGGELDVELARLRMLLSLTPDSYKELAKEYMPAIADCIGKLAGQHLHPAIKDPEPYSPSDRQEIFGDPPGGFYEDFKESDL